MSNRFSMNPRCDLGRQMPERSTKLILQRGRLGANSGATEEHMTTANATIRKVFDGFKVTVTMRQDRRTTPAGGRYIDQQDDEVGDHLDGRVVIKHP